MGFYYRKSVSVGPLRFNFSQSGIGVSTGIPGFRIGTGPRGNYVHIGRGGLYYRATLPSIASITQGPPPVSNDGAVTNPSPSGATSLISSGPVSRMVDRTSQNLIDEINEKKQRISLAPLVAVFSAVIVGALLWNAVPLPAVLILGALLAIGIFAAHQYDTLRKSVVVMFDLEEESSCAFQQLFTTVEEIGTCGKRLHVHQREAVVDRKYSAGAHSTLQGSAAYVTTANPPYINTNVSIPGIQFKGNTLHFFPNLILLFTRDGVGVIQYQDLSVTIEDSPFVEDGAVPRDAEIVGQTWRYVNKDGGPDRRFKDNPPLPICLYEELHLASSTGLREVFQLSKRGLGSKLLNAISQMNHAIKLAENAEVHRQDLLRTERQNPPPRPREAQPKQIDESPNPSSCRIESPELLFDFLCCIMAVDGKISAAERDQIHRFMCQAYRGWSKKGSEDRLLYFVERVRLRGFNNVVDSAIMQIKKSYENGSNEILPSLINSIQHADFGIDAKGVRLLKQLQEQLMASR